MQTLIALVSFAVLGSTSLFRMFKASREPSLGPSTLPRAFSMSLKPELERHATGPNQSHLALWLRALCDFHVAQCYFSIALQLASFVALFGRSNEHRNQYDE